MSWKGSGFVREKPNPSSLRTSKLAKHLEECQQYLSPAVELMAKFIITKYCHKSLRLINIMWTLWVVPALGIIKFCSSAGVL